MFIVSESLPFSSEVLINFIFFLVLIYRVMVACVKKIYIYKLDRKSKYKILHLSKIFHKNNFYLAYRSRVKLKHISLNVFICSYLYLNVFYNPNSSFPSRLLLLHLFLLRYSNAKLSL